MNDSNNSLWSATSFRFATLLLLAAMLFLIALNSYQLRSSTEPRVAGIAAEVLIDNDWVTPKLNGSPFLEKPPLSIWLDALGIKVFGATPLAVRLASACAGILTALIVFTTLVRLQKDNTGAWLAGLLLITMAQFWSNVRQVGEDALLTVGVTLCLSMYLRAMYLQTTSPTQARPAFGAWLLFALGLAIATLSKGVLGLALPGAVIFTYLLSRTAIAKRFVLSDWLLPAAAALLGLIPLLIWLWFLYQRSGSGAVAEVLWANSVGRFGGEFENNGHYEPFYYYLTKLPEIFLPWNILVFLGLWQLLKRAKADSQALFFCCWLLAPFALLSLSSGKRMVYLLALYPAAAVIAAGYCVQLLEYCNKNAPASGLVNWLYRQRNVLTTSLIVLISAGFIYRATVWEPKQDRKESFDGLVAQLNEQQLAGRHIALYQPSERLAGALVFYTGRTYPELDTSAAVQDFLSADGNNVVLQQNDGKPPAAAQVIYRATVGKRAYLFFTQ